jgi:hypothetical protein
LGRRRTLDLRSRITWTIEIELSETAIRCQTVMEELKFLT